MYSLTIRRYGRHLNFDSYEEFEAEVKRYFTPRESAIVWKLTHFNNAEDCGGYYRNSYQDMETFYYPEEA